MTDLKAHLNIPRDKRSDLWSHELYRLVPLNHFKVVGSMIGPHGRPYANVMIVEPGDDGKVMEFSNLVQYCLDRDCGFAITLSEGASQPDAVLRFGSIWSYHEYKDLGGCANVVADFEKASQIFEDSPFNAVVGSEQDVAIGAPSDAFFPGYVRDLITKDIREILPGAMPEFSLLEQKFYAMPFSIFLDLCCDCDDGVRQDIKNRVLWFMPPYLPITIKE